MDSREEFHRKLSNTFVITVLNFYVYLKAIFKVFCFFSIYYIHSNWLQSRFSSDIFLILSLSSDQVSNPCIVVGMELTTFILFYFSN